MFLAGLTGGIASGKSTVARRLVERGAELIDADAIAREVVLPGTATWRKIREHFGDDVLDADGFVDRPALGRVVFADPTKRTLLNELTHPPVLKEIASRLELLTAFDGVVVVDVPLLVEVAADRARERSASPPPTVGGLQPDAIVVVATLPETQERRLVRERGMTAEAARARVAAQAPLEDKVAVATHVIWNEGTLAELEAEADRVADELTRLAKEKVARESSDIPDD